MATNVGMGAAIGTTAAAGLCFFFPPAAAFLGGAKVIIGGAALLGADVGWQMTKAGIADRIAQEATRIANECIRLGNEKIDRVMNAAEPKVVEILEETSNAIKDGRRIVKTWNNFLLTNCSMVACIGYQQYVAADTNDCSSNPLAPECVMSITATALFCISAFKVFLIVKDIGAINDLNSLEKVVQEQSNKIKEIEKRIREYEEREKKRMEFKNKLQNLLTRIQENRGFNPFDDLDEGTAGQLCKHMWIIGYENSCWSCFLDVQWGQHAFQNPHPSYTEYRKGAIWRLMKERQLLE